MVRSGFSVQLLSAFLLLKKTAEVVPVVSEALALKYVKMQHVSLQYSYFLWWAKT